MDRRHDSHAALALRGVSHALSHLKNGERLGLDGEEP
jgi:hypothetical protein